MMVNSIKIQLMSMYFNYTVSDVVNELNPSTKLRKNMQDFLKKHHPQSKSINT